MLAPAVESSAGTSYEPPSRVGVLLIHRGEPPTLAAVKPWLKQWYADPYAFSVPFGREAQSVFAAIASRWGAGGWTSRLQEAGGSSPLFAQALQLADRLQRRLNGAGEGTANAKFTVRVGTPYCEPSIARALADFKADGLARVVAISLYPQQCDRFLRPLRRAIEQAAQGLEVSVIDRYPVAADYIASLRAAIDAALVRAGDATVLFAALAIDRRDEQQGDPYPDQLKLTTSAAMEGLTAPWRVSWLESGAPGLPTQFVLDRLYDKGVQNVVLVPLGSAVDELATVHTLDVSLRQHARAKGFAKVERARSVAAEPSFVEALRVELLGHLERLSKLGFTG